MTNQDPTQNIARLFDDLEETTNNTERHVSTKTGDALGTWGDQYALRAEDDPPLVDAPIPTVPAPAADPMLFGVTPFTPESQMQWIIAHELPDLSTIRDEDLRDLLTFKEQAETALSMIGDIVARVVGAAKAKRDQLYPHSPLRADDPFIRNKAFAHYQKLIDQYVEYEGPQSNPHWRWKGPRQSQTGKPLVIFPKTSKLAVRVAWEAFHQELMPGRAQFDNFCGIWDCISPHSGHNKPRSQRVLEAWPGATTPRPGLNSEVIVLAPKEQRERFCKYNHAQKYRNRSGRWICRTCIQDRRQGILGWEAAGFDGPPPPGTMIGRTIQDRSHTALPALEVSLELQSNTDEIPTNELKEILTMM